MVTRTPAVATSDGVMRPRNTPCWPIWSAEGAVQPGRARYRI